MAAFEVEMLPRWVAWMAWMAMWVAWVLSLSGRYLDLQTSISQCQVGPPSAGSDPLIFDSNLPKNLITIGAVLGESHTTDHLAISI